MVTANRTALWVAFQPPTCGQPGLGGFAGWLRCPASRRSTRRALSLLAKSKFLPPAALIAARAFALQRGELHRGHALFLGLGRDGTVCEDVQRSSNQAHVDYPSGIAGVLLIARREKSYRVS